MSPLGVSITVDVVQTTAIIMLAAAVCFLVWRSDKRFYEQHRDAQDVILTQYKILKQISEHQGKIDLLDEKLTQLDGRVRTALKST